MSHIEEGTLHAYLDGECAEREIEQIEAHLAICDACQERLEAATAASRTASDLLAEVEPGPVSAPTWRDLEARAAARARSAPRRTWVRPSLAWAAMIVIAFGIGWISNTYWSAARFAPSSSLRSETPVAASDALEEEQLPQAPAQTRSGAQVGERSAEPEFRNEQLSYDRRLKVASELPKTEPKPGRGATVEGAVETADQEEALAAARRRSQEAENRTQAVTEDVAARPPAEPSPAVAGVQATRELAERRERQDFAADRAVPEAETLPALAAQKSLLQAEVDELAPSFFSVHPEDAAAWLNGDLRTLPDLQLKRVEVGPGAAVPGALPGLPAVRLIYEDAVGHPFILIQQRLVNWGADTEAQPVLSVEPSGEVAYRWVDARGYRLILIGNVSSDSLRALAERLR